MMAALTNADDQARDVAVKEQWCQVHVGTWQSGAGPVSFGPDCISWVTQRKVPGAGFVTIEVSTRTIHSAIFKRGSSVLRIQGSAWAHSKPFLLDRWYDPCNADPGMWRLLRDLRLPTRDPLRPPPPSLM